MEKEYQTEKLPPIPQIQGSITYFSDFNES